MQPTTDSPRGSQPLSRSWLPAVSALLLALLALWSPSTRAQDAAYWGTAEDWRAACGGNFREDHGGEGSFWVVSQDLIDCRCRAMDSLLPCCSKTNKPEECTWEHNIDTCCHEESHFEFNDWWDGCSKDDLAALSAIYNACNASACEAACRRWGYDRGTPTDAYGTRYDYYCACADPSAQAAPPPATYNPSITLVPPQGSAGSQAEAGGQGFPPNTQVEVRWDGEGGLLVGEGRSDGAGNLRVRFVVPEDAAEGEHEVVVVYSDAGGRRWVSARFMVRELCIEGKVRVRMRDGWPLQGVAVSLWWSDPALPHNPTLAPDSNLGAPVPTGADGSYRICNPLIGVPSRHWLLQVQLSEVRTNSFGLFDFPAVDPARGFFGAGGEIGADLGDPATWFSIETEADLIKDLWFEDRADKAETARVREDHGLDAALIYYHMHQAVRVYQGLGVPLAQVLIPVVAFDPGGTRAGATGIFIGEADSEWNSNNAPKNQEWHELSHYVMLLTYGRFPPLHAEAGGLDGDINGNHIPDLDTNHGGYLGNALSSSDAMVEGFAAFMPMVIADQMDRLGEPYMNDTLAPYIYTVSEGATPPQLYNLELNHPQNVLSSLPQEDRTTFYDHLKAQRSRPLPDRVIWRFRSDEEDCVASLLWDLYDPPDEPDRDAVELPLQTLWNILSGTYTFPRYYDGRVITRFLGDGEVYGGRWEYYDTANELGAYTGQRDRSAPFATEVRHIYYIKDLYDALVARLPDRRQAIEQVFAGHRVTMNTYQVYEDYAAAGSIVLSTFGDAGTRAQVALGPEAAYSFWGQGLVADVTVSGWGAGFSVGRGLPVDARAYVYLLLWMNAPAQTAFDVVLEDDAGQWLCPGTSQALYEQDATPSDWPLFQQGTGNWAAYSPPYATGGPYPYAVVIAPAYGVWWADGWAHVYKCVPNPNYRTPPAERKEPNVAKLQAVGVLFKSPGSYRALVGGMLLSADYPWKAGVRTLYGMGDPGQGIWLPYRRSRPPLEGGKALIQVDRAPATVWVSYEYGAPYEALSFRYPVQMTGPSREIGLYIEPAFEGQENRLRFSAQVEGYKAGEAVALTSTEYWTMWNGGGAVMQVSLVAGAEPGSGETTGGDDRSAPGGGAGPTGGTLTIDATWLLRGGLCCGGALVAGGAGVLFLVRRKGRRSRRT